MVNAQVPYKIIVFLRRLTFVLAYHDQKTNYTVLDRESSCDFRVTCKVR